MLGDVRHCLTDDGLEVSGDDGGLAPVPGRSFRKLDTRFRADDDPSFQSAPKAFRSTESHDSLLSGD